MTRFVPAVAALLLCSCSSISAQIQQGLTCTTSSVPLMMHAEAITDPIGEIEIDCAGGSPSAQAIENITIQLNVPITNRIDSHNDTDAVLTADSGSGPVAITTPGVLMSPNTVVWNGAKFPLSPTGTVSLRFSNIRVNATAATPSPGGQILANIVVGGNILDINKESLLAGTTFVGLYSNYSGKIVCTQAGASVPDNLSFSQFISAGAVFTTTRVTEGFASALVSKSDPANLNADTGDRILVNFTGLSPKATLYVPMAIAGSDATRPTAGGDFGVPASGGIYTSSASSGSLLLALVKGADSNGAGGALLFNRPSPGSPAVVLDNLEIVPVGADGSAMVVYEVIDSSDTTQETAQFPTFLSVPPSGSGVTYVSNEMAMLAPVSTVTSADPTAPVPRFIATVAPNDCSVMGDCSAIYFPHLSVSPASFNLTQTAGLKTSQLITITNTGENTFGWSSVIGYANGSGTGWLSLDPASWSAPGGATLMVDTTNVQPGTYAATIGINAGSAGSAQIPVTLTVTPAAGPFIRSVSSSANFQGPIVAGSLGTIFGGNFTEPVTVTVGGQTAQILYSSSSQINLLVPASLAGQAVAEIVVSNNGTSMAPWLVPLAPFSPAIFPGAVLNQDNTVNGTAHLAPPGTALQIFGTGISTGGTVTGQIAGQTYTPEYAGPAPGLPGVQQVNVRIPANYPPGQYFLQICESGSGSLPVCSPPAWLQVGK